MRTLARTLSAKAALTLSLALIIAAALLFTVATAPSAEAKERGNPCGVNPCSVKNPCGVQNPCSMKGASDNSPIRKWRMTNSAKVADLGERLWVDSTLGKSGLSCSTCHPGGAQLNSKQYPKYIGMADDILTLDQMINFCMVNPMKGKRIKWNSQKMTALAAYVVSHSCATNPCSTKNPCGVNPCSANPCGSNPCSTANPCASNPCGVNPCATNPCATKNPCGANPCSANPCAR